MKIRESGFKNGTMLKWCRLICKYLINLSWFFRALVAVGSLIRFSSPFKLQNSFMELLDVFWLKSPMKT